MSSDKEQFMELGVESEELSAIHEESGEPKAVRRIQSPYTEQRITSLVVVPTVAVPASATVDPDADPLMTRLGTMTTPELTTYIKDEIALGERVLADEKLAADEHKRIKGQRLQVTYEVICALRELKSRCKATKTWEKALKECGIAPSTWRSWDCRELNQLTTGKRTKSRKKPKADKQTYAQLHADVAAAKAAVDAQRAASLAQPDPVDQPVEAEYIDDPTAPVEVMTVTLTLNDYETGLLDFLRAHVNDDFHTTCYSKVCEAFRHSRGEGSKRSEEFMFAETLLRRVGLVKLSSLDDDDMTTMDYIVAGDEPEPPTPEPDPPAAAAKVCPKCGKQYSRYWVRLYDRDIRYRHAGKRDATRDEDCYVPYETETTDTGVSVTPTTQTTNLKVKDEATI